jgi:hypothetical protein
MLDKFILSRYDLEFSFVINAQNLLNLDIDVKIDLSRISANLFLIILTSVLSYLSCDVTELIRPANYDGVTMENFGCSNIRVGRYISISPRNIQG